MVHGKLGNENMHAQKWVYVVSFQQCGHIGCIQNRRTRNWEALSIHMKIKKMATQKEEKHKDDLLFANVNRYAS